MGQSSVHFFSEDISFNIKQKMRLRTWINNTVKDENFQLKELNFIFCSDNYLLSINQEYLKHDTLTDIVAFDNSEKQGQIVSDIFISIERVRENALNFNVSEEEELHRVMIHGILHLVGYPDKGKEAKALMTEKENFYLQKRLL